MPAVLEQKPTGVRYGIVALLFVLTTINYADRIFNAIGNIAGITTPIVIGYIVHQTGSYDVALMFVAAHSICGLLSYVLIVGDIRRFALREVR